MRRFIDSFLRCHVYLCTHILLKQFLSLLVTYNAAAYTVSGHVQRKGKHFEICHLLDLWLCKLFFLFHLLLHLTQLNSFILFATAGEWLLL